MRTTIVICLTLAAFLLPAAVPAADQEPVGAAEAKGPGRLAFIAEGKEFRFDTGVLRGTLRPQGKSLGLSPVIDSASGATLSGGAGLFSHYRLLDAEARYGGGAWDWPSTARALADGSVEAAWSAQEGLPFDMKALYRWKASNVLDLVMSVTPKKDLARFESFLASYFNGFPESLVYVKACPQTGGKTGLLAAVRANGDWQMFPRDDASLKIIGDGRWKRPPNPVQWTIMPPLAGALAVRRDAQSGLAALIMAPPDDCFAIATPYGEEGHRSIYLSLLGRDLKAGQTATARSRLVIGRNISDEQAVAVYQAYLKEARSLNP
jgi:hypothetical protein